MPEITPNAIVTVPSEVLVQDLPDGEIVLLSLTSENYFGLDGMGARMWAELTDGKSIRAIAEELSGEFDADAGVLEGDLLDLVDQLVRAGLATISDA
jgi:hypothetical protein